MTTFNEDISLKKPSRKGSPLRKTKKGAQRQELRVAMIREEFVTLTKDPMTAIVLNQLVYWTERVKDFDFFLAEEKAMNPACNVHPRHGWIYKSADELSEETMLQVSRSTMLRYLQSLITAGWIDKRSNDKNKWDKTIQYRVNLRKLQENLSALGYTLSGTASLHLSCFQKNDTVLNEISNDASIFQTERSNVQSDASRFQNETSISEITSEITNREHTLRARDFQSKDDLKDFSERMIEIWKAYLEQRVHHLTPERKFQLNFIFDTFFQNDIVQWERFCERVKASPFLMGQGTRKWHVTLDWILSKDNLVKVLEGNFDDPDVLIRDKAEETNELRNHQITAILNTIEDPIWKHWCSQLAIASLKEALPFQEYLSSADLETIAKARFSEIEQDRLVWIESSDIQTLNKIEELRLPLLSIIQRTYPNTRNIRTKMQESNAWSQEATPSQKNNSDSRHLTPTTLTKGEHHA